MAKKGINIYKRKDNRWEARYVKGRTPSGKIQYGYVYGKSYHEARDKQLQAQTMLAYASAPAEKRRQRFAHYCEDWLLLNRSRIKKSSYTKYYNIVHNHILPLLGDYHPQDMNTGVVEAFSHHLLTRGALHGGRGLSPRGVRDILTVLHAILKYTRKQPGSGLPEIDVIYPKEPRQEMRVLSHEEQDKLIRYLLLDMDCCKFGVLLALLTGMRLGEVCALRWRDISLEEKTIHITATMQRLQTLDDTAQKKTHVTIGEPKSATSRRKIPLTDYTAALCGKMAVPEPDAFVLTGRADRFMEPRTVQYRLGKYTAACGLEHVNFHALRHTFATRCVEVDFEIKSLSEILGHSTVKITLDRYVHSSMELKRENMQKLKNIGF